MSNPISFGGADLAKETHGTESLAGVMGLHPGGI